jgi:peptidyl-prolyl cis-trans isomerase D
MLSQLRALAKSPIFVGLMALLVISFLVWSIRDVFKGAGARDAVVQAGSRTIDSTRFRQDVERALAQYGQQMGQQIALQDAVKAGVDRQIADSLATEESFFAYLARVGIRPSDRLVVKSLRQMTGFFNPVSGQFDRKAYERLLAQNGLTTQRFEADLRDDVAQQQFISGIVGGLQTPAVFAAIPAAYEAEGRTFAWFPVGPQAIGPIPPPTDAQLTAFMKENEAQLRRPETRVLNVVRFSAPQLAPTLPVDPAAVQKRFEFEKDTLSQPEKRSLVQITVNDPRKAADAAARLQRGEDPAAVAKAVGASPLVLTDVPRTAVADRKVADAAFALEPGQSSGVIRGDLGTAVVKVLKATPGHTVTLEEARPRIEAEVRKQAAEEKTYAQVQKFEDARAGGSNLIEAAKAAGVQPVTVGPISAQGVDAQGKPVGLPPKVLQAAFGLQAGADSEAQDLGGGEWMAVRVEKLQPPALPALAEIRDRLAQVWTFRERSNRLRAKAEELAAQVRQGQPVATVAASIHATPGDAVGIRRSQAGQTFSRDFLGRIFAASKPGDVVIGEDPKLGFVVGRLQAVIPGAPAEIARGAAGFRENATLGYQRELVDAVRAAARRVIKPKVDYARAHSAVGGDQGAGPAQ